jgi:hypothetical protein
MLHTGLENQASMKLEGIDKRGFKADELALIASAKS